MTMRDIQFILTIMESKSMTEAAAKLYIAQSALSQCVKKVERELGAELFSRENGKSLTPTAAGEGFRQMAVQVLGPYHSYLQKLQENARQGQKIRIGLPILQGNSILAALYETVGSLFVNINCEFVEDSSMALEKRLMDGTLDMAVTRLPAFNSCLSQETIFREQLGIWLRSGSPAASLAYRKGGAFPYLPPEALNGETLALPPEYTRIRKAIEQILKNHGITPGGIIPSRLRGNALLMARNGRCSTISTAPSQENDSEGFYLIEGNDITYDWGLIYSHESDLELTARLCAILREQPQLFLYE